MQQLEILNSRKVKEILHRINEQWGCDFQTDIVFLQSSNDKIHVVSRGFEKLDTAKMKIDSLGMYFAAWDRGQFRLSIEGSQLVGPKATKNVAELSDDEVQRWIRGEDIEKQTGIEGFAIIRHGSDYFGCGNCHPKKIINFFPKARRISI